MIRVVREDILHKCSLGVSEGSLVVKNLVEHKEWVTRYMLYTSTAEFIHHMTSCVPEWILCVKMRPHGEQFHTSSCSLFFPCIVLTTIFLLTWNSLVHSDSRPILGDPQPAARFQGAEKTSVHPRAGYSGTDHRIWPKCNYTFLEPQSVSTIHIASWCMFTYRQHISRTRTAFVPVSCCV
jgi:hypothetical protein